MGIIHIGPINIFLYEIKDQNFIRFQRAAGFRKSKRLKSNSWIIIRNDSGENRTINNLTIPPRSIATVPVSYSSREDLKRRGITVI